MNTKELTQRFRNYHIIRYWINMISLVYISLFLTVIIVLVFKDKIYIDYILLFVTTIMIAGVIKIDLMAERQKKIFNSHEGDKFISLLCDYDYSEDTYNLICELIKKNSYNCNYHRSLLIKEAEGKNIFGMSVSLLSIILSLNLNDFKPEWDKFYTYSVFDRLNSFLPIILGGIITCLILLVAFYLWPALRANKYLLSIIEKQEET